MTTDEDLEVAYAALTRLDGQVLDDYYDCGCGALVDHHTCGAHTEAGQES